MEYEQRFFTQQPTDCLIDNEVERFKLSYIERLFDNRMYEINHWDFDFYYFPFCFNEMLIDRRQIYRINDDIVFRLNNGLSVYV